MTMALWDVIRAEAMTCKSTQELILQDVFARYGTQMMMTEMDMLQSLNSNLTRRQKEQSRNRASDLLSSSLLIRSLLHQLWKAPISAQLEILFEPTSGCINDIKEERCNVRPIRDTHSSAGFTSIILSIIIRLRFTQQMLHGYLFMEKATRTQNHEKTFEQSHTESFYEFW